MALKKIGIVLSVLIVFLLALQALPVPVGEIPTTTETRSEIIVSRADIVGSKMYFNETFTVDSGWDHTNLFAAVWIQETTYKSKTVGGYSFKSSETFQAFMDPLDGAVTTTGTQKHCLFELGTGTWCGYCPAADGSFDRIVDDAAYFPAKTVPITWHSGGSDPYQNTDSNNRLGASGYDIPGFPGAFFDGVDMEVGGGTDPDSTAKDATYKNKINTQAGKSTDFKITTFGTASASSGWINATIEFLAVPTATQFHVYIALVEDLDTTYSHSGDNVPLRHTGRDIIMKELVSVPNDPPTISLTSDFSGQQLEGIKTITWTASDPEQDDSQLNIKIDIQQDGGAWTNIVSMFNTGTYDWDTSTTEDGANYKLRVKVTDSHLNEDTDEGLGTFSIDNPNLPVVTLTDPNGGGVYAGSIDITWTAEDDEDGSSVDIDIRYLDVGDVSWHDIILGTENDGSYTWDITSIPDGYYQVKVTATDTDSMEGYSQSAASFQIDNLEAPVVTLTHPPAGATLKDAYTIQWDSTDSEDARKDLKATIELQQDGGVWTELVKDIKDDGLWSFDTKTVADSEDCKLRVTIKDTDDMFTVAESGTFAIYNPDAPVITSDAFTPEEFTEDLEITWTATDADDDTLTIDIEYSPDGTLWLEIAKDEENDGAYTLDTTTIEDGTYYFRLAATDNSPGALKTYFQTSVAKKIYNPDTPVIALKGLSGGQVIGGSFTLEWEASDGDVGETLTYDVYYSYDETEWTELEKGIKEDVTTKTVDTKTLTNGAVYFKVVATDDSPLALSAEAVSPKMNVMNNDAPTVAFTLPKELATVMDNVELKWTVTDANGDDVTITLKAGDKVLLDNVADPGTYEWDSTTVDNGKVVITLEATDGSLKTEAKLTLEVSNTIITDNPKEEDPVDDDITNTGDNKGSNMGVIAFVIILVVVLLLAGVGLVIFLVMKKKSKPSDPVQPQAEQAPVENTQREPTYDPYASSMYGPQTQTGQAAPDYGAQPAQATPDYGAQPAQAAPDYGAQPAQATPAQPAYGAVQQPQQAQQVSPAPQQPQLPPGQV